MSTATVPVTAPLSISATITGVGRDSSAPDRPDAVDLEIRTGDVPGRGELIGSATLLRDHTGEHGPWGSHPDHWADSGLQSWIGFDGDGRLDLKRAGLVVAACRKAIRLEAPFA